MIKKGNRKIRGKRASAYRRNLRRKRGKSQPSKNSISWQSEHSHAPEIAGEKDPHEKSADKAADRLAGISPVIQTKADGVSRSSTSSKFVQMLNKSKGSGSQLPEKTQKSMGSKLGISLKDVRIHTDKNASNMSREINARAFTHGRDIYFKEGHFKPDTKDGQHLIAHEIAHTQQQTSKIHRAPERNAAGNLTGNYTFSVGSGISRGFMDKAKSMTSDGALNRDEVNELRIYAITRRGTVTHAERLLMAALLNPVVVPVLQADNTGTITVPFVDITRANRDIVRQSGQENIPDDVTNLMARAFWLTFTGSEEEITQAIKELNETTTQAILDTAGTFKHKAAKVIAFANKKNVFLPDVLRAMVNGASDNSNGDQYMAGLAYSVMIDAGQAEAARIASGQLKIDAMSDSAYEKTMNQADGMYTPIGGGDITKGDTIYLRTSFSIDNVNDRALLVHEFTHFLQDLAQAAPTSVNVIPQEIAAYQAQARYTMYEIISEGDAREKLKLTKQAKNALPAFIQWAYIMVTKADQARYKATAVAVLTQLSSISEANVNAALAMTNAQLTTNITNALTASGLYNVGAQAVFDGNSGHSLLDHFN